METLIKMHCTGKCARKNECTLYVRRVVWAVGACDVGYITHLNYGRSAVYTSTS